MQNSDSGRVVSPPLQDGHAGGTDHRVSLICPSCRSGLTRVAEGWSCSREGVLFSVTDEIPDFLLPHRREILHRFLAAYGVIRSAEGWGSDRPAYYRELPYRDRSGRHRAIWRLRARAYDCLREHLLHHVPPRAARILDAGAGNCWLAGRLAALGYDVVALDISLDRRDGLGAARMLPPEECSRIFRVRAEFDAPPFPDDSFEAVVFNASLHYCRNVSFTVGRAARMVRPGGVLYVLDSPLFDDREEGEEMMRERLNGFCVQYGLDLHGGESRGYLTPDDFRTLGLPCRVNFLSPQYGLRTRLRRMLPRLPRRRAPAEFSVIAVERI